MDEFSTFQSERLLFRPLSMDDVPRFRKLLQAREIAENGLNVHHPYQEGDAERMIETALRGPDHHRYTWGIVIKAVEELSGLIMIKVIPAHFCGEIGYWIGKDYWNRGYTTEAVQRMLAYGFGPLGLNRIFGRSFPDNPASSRVMEKAGMVYEGRLRQELWHELQQEFKDLLVFSILRSEYEASQAS